MGLERRPACPSQNLIRLRTPGDRAPSGSSLGFMAGGSFNGSARCGRGFASALTLCWNWLSFAINLWCWSERAHGVHVCAQASGCYGLSLLKSPRGAENDWRFSRAGHTVTVMVTILCALVSIFEFRVRSRASGGLRAVLRDGRRERFAQPLGMHGDLDAGAFLLEQHHRA
jgi:hypothetical protein